MSDTPPIPTGRFEVPPLPESSSDGVDVSLIRWMLSLTPRERLAVLQNAVDSLAKLRDVTAKNT